MPSKQAKAISSLVIINPATAFTCNFNNHQSQRAFSLPSLEIDHQDCLKYFAEIEQCTRSFIPLAQKKHLFTYLEDIYCDHADGQKVVEQRLRKKNRKSERRRFARKRHRLIKEWEQETGKKWPRLQEDIFAKNGVKARKRGSHFDAHHIFEIFDGGPSVWWNIWPAHPDDHQNCIHDNDGEACRLFN